MGKLILDGAAGALVEVVILIVMGIVLLDRVKNMTRDLNVRVYALETWRDGHIASSQPHALIEGLGRVGNLFLAFDHRRIRDLSCIRSHDRIIPAILFSHLPIVAP
jgi:hypothetical protein